jgi:uncharacterized protein (DUF927 family)
MTVNGAVRSGTDASSTDGAGKTESTLSGGLRNAATWTDLGFSTDVWDFSGLAAGWPVPR